LRDPDLLDELQHSVTSAADEYLQSCINPASRCLLLRERVERTDGRVMPHHDIVSQLRHYLLLAKPADRKAFTWLMHSQHHLAVEVLRHPERYRPHVPREQRLCRLCQTAVEDEVHIFLLCTANKDLVRLRLLFLNDIASYWPPDGYNSLPPEQLLYSLIGDDRLGACMGKYLRDVFAVLDTVPLRVPRPETSSLNHPR